MRATGEGGQQKLGFPPVHGDRRASAELAGTADKERRGLCVAEATCAKADRPWRPGSVTNFVCGRD